MAPRDQDSAAPHLADDDLFNSWAEVGLDPTKPNIARVYDYWLGGRHDLVADRELAEAMATLDPRTGTVLACLTIPGQPEQVRIAREFVETELGADRPFTFAAVLLTSELVTNSMLHSNSGLSGETITITVASSPGGARVEVRDAGGISIPFPHARDDLADHGRGLQLVKDLSARWGYRSDLNDLVTWFEVSAEPP